MGFKCLGCAMFVVMTVTTVCLFHWYMKNNIAIVRVSSPAELTTITVTNEPFINPVAEELIMDPITIVKRSTSNFNRNNLSRATNQVRDSFQNISQESGETKTIEIPSGYDIIKPKDQYSKSDKIISKSDGIFERSNYMPYMKENKETPKEDTIPSIIKKLNDTSLPRVTSKEVIDSKSENKSDDTIFKDLMNVTKNISLPDFTNSTVKAKNTFSIEENITDSQNSLETKNCTLTWNHIEEIEEYLHMYENLKKKIISEKINNTLSENDAILKKEQLLLDSLEKNLTSLLSNGKMNGYLDDAEGEFYPSTEVSLAKSIEATNDLPYGSTISTINRESSKPHPLISRKKIEPTNFNKKNSTLKHSTDVVEITPNNLNYKSNEWVKRKSFLHNKSSAIPSFRDLNSNNFKLLDSAFKMGNIVVPESEKSTSNNNTELDVNGQLNNTRMNYLGNIVNVTSNESSDTNGNVTENTENMNNLDKILESTSNESTNNRGSILNATPKNINNRDGTIKVKSNRSSDNLDTHRNAMSYTTSIKNLDETSKATSNEITNNTNSIVDNTQENTSKLNRIVAVASNEASNESISISNTIVNVKSNNTGSNKIVISPSNKSTNNIDTIVNATSNNTSIDNLYETVKNASNENSPGTILNDLSNITSRKKLDEIVKSTSNERANNVKEIIVNSTLNNTSINHLVGHVNVTSNESINNLITSNDKSRNNKKKEIVNFSSNTSTNKPDEIIKTISNKSINKITTNIDTKLNISDKNLDPTSNKKTINHPYPTVNVSSSQKSVNNTDIIENIFNLRNIDHQDIVLNDTSNRIDDSKIIADKNDYEETLKRFNNYKKRETVLNNNYNIQEPYLEKPIDIRGSANNVISPVYIFVTEKPNLDYDVSEDTEDSQNDIHDDEIVEITEYPFPADTVLQTNHTEGDETALMNFEETVKEEFKNSKPDQLNYVNSFQKNGIEKANNTNLILKTKHHVSHQGVDDATSTTHETHVDSNILNKEPIKSRLSSLLKRIIYHPDHPENIEYESEEPMEVNKLPMRVSKIDKSFENSLQNVPCESLSSKYSESEEYENMLRTLNDVHFNSDIDEGIELNTNKFKRENSKDIPCKEKKKPKKTIKQAPRADTEEDQMEEEEEEENIQEDPRNFVSPIKKAIRRNALLSLKNKLRREEAEMIQDEDELSEELEETANLISPLTRKKIKPKLIVPALVKIKQALKVPKPVKTDLKALLNKKTKKIPSATKYEENVGESSDLEEDLNENGLPDIVYIPFKNSNNLDVKSLLLLSNALSKGDNMNHIQPSPDTGYQGRVNGYYYGPTNPGSPSYLGPSNPGSPSYLGPSNPGPTSYLGPANSEPINYMGPTNPGTTSDSSHYSNSPQYSRERYDHDSYNYPDRYWQGKRKRKVGLDAGEEPAFQHRRSFFNIEEPTREIANIVKSFQELSQQFKKN